MIKNVLENIDYFHLFKGGKVILMFTGQDLDGKTKTELQQAIGNRLGNGTYTYSMKYLNDAKNYRGKIRGFCTDNKKDLKEDLEMTDPALIAVLGKLAERLDTKSDDSSKVSNQIEKFYKLQIELLEKNLQKLEKELEKAKKDSESGSGGIDLSTLMSLQNMMTGTKQPIQGFQANASGSGIRIPGAIITVLRKVDFSKMDENTKDDLANSLEKYIKYVKLPLINETNFKQTTIEE